MGSADAIGEISIGVTMLDSEHREQFEIVTEIQEILVFDQNRRQIGFLLRQLERLNLAHEEFEEDMMMASKYPGLAAHSRDHALMAERIQTLVRLHSQCASASFGESLESFSKCFVSHVQFDDTNYGLWINR
jgi:hemerythrin-like metal-binding protein